MLYGFSFLKQKLIWGKYRNEKMFWNKNTNIAFVSQRSISQGKKVSKTDMDSITVLLSSKAAVFY